MEKTHHYKLGGKVWTVKFTRLRGTAIGYAYLSHDRILIDEKTYRKKNRAAMELVIHEAYHALNPAYDESVVEQHAADLARLLWGLGFRFVRD